MMKKGLAEKRCLKKCPPDCNEVKYTVSVEKTPLDLENGICASPNRNKESVHDGSIWNHIFGMGQVNSKFRWNKNTPTKTLAKIIRNRLSANNKTLGDVEYCIGKVSMDIAIVNVVVNSPTVLKFVQDIKTTFADKLASFG